MVPAFSGLTRPNSEVAVRLQKMGAEPSVLRTTANNEGQFTVIPGSALQTGVYDLSATAVDQFGAQSEPSETIRFVVEEPGYIAVGSLLLSVMSIVVPLLALVLLLILGGVYLWRRLRALKWCSAETAEALSVLKTQFTELETRLRMKLTH